MAKKLKASKIVAGEMERALSDLEDCIIKRINAGNIPPALKPETVERKGHDKTLLDSTALLGSIHHKITVAGREVIGFVGVMDAAVEEYAWTQEYGFPMDFESTTSNINQKIPTRSYLRVPYDENIDRISSKFEQRVGDKLIAEMTAKKRK
jgi:hypothetical protein